MIPKFRAWDRKNKVMRDVKGLIWEETDLIGHCNLIAHCPPRGHEFNEWFTVTLDGSKYQLIQSTGMKDKNGVEIFEGDVVAVENHPFQRKEDSGVGMEIEGNYVVGWNQHDLTWCAGDLLLARLKPYVKVIGNIYENPELLEEQR